MRDPGAIRAIEAIGLEDIRDARARLPRVATHTPLMRLEAGGTDSEIYLKLESLQPIGSFKIRGAANALALADQDALRASGVYTASAGNMAQGVAWSARRLDAPCRVIVPERAPRTKLDAIARLGGDVVKVPFDDWWRVIVQHGYPGESGLFVHPVSDPAVIAGHGTIGLEIIEDLPDVDAVVIPYGGGGLLSGIASAMKGIKPDIRVYAAEVTTAAPLSVSLAAGEPRAVDRIQTFVDGIGGKSVLAEMWPIVRRLVDDSVVVSIEEVVDAIRLLVERNNVVAEGAGAAPVAAALTGAAGPGKIVCVVSGGNIDLADLSTILDGGVPSPLGIS